MATRSRFFFKALLTSYAVVGYGIPIACTFYHEKIKNKYCQTRKSFKTSQSCFVFPFYFSRKVLETQLRSKLESKEGEIIFIYGKSFIGKSTLIRKVCSQIQDNVLRMNAYSFEPFHKTLAKRLHFQLSNHYSWHNLWQNIYFPLGMCTMTAGTAEQQLRRTLSHLSSFCALQKQKQILVIDDAENLTKDQFCAMYKCVSPLIQQKLLTLVIVSSDPAFAAYITSEKFKNIKRLQMDEMNAFESCQFLESQPCQLFVNRMRAHHGLAELTKAQIREAYDIAGGIPLWLIQCCVKSPQQWLEHRTQNVRSVIDKQKQCDIFYKVQSYMVTNQKKSLGFKEFMSVAGNVDNAVTLLHGIPRQHKYNRLFFHDLNKNNVSLQYQYLMHVNLSSNIKLID